MRSATPKVLHEIGGRSLLGHVLAAAADSGAADVAVVVGHGRDEVEPHVTACLPAARTAVQHEQLGTGHAAMVGLDAVPADDGTVLVVMGDTPLLRGDLLRRLSEAHAAAGGVITVLTARPADPSGYGRVLRDGTGAVTGVVEHKDATDAQKRLDEVNTGMYAFDLAWVRAALPRVGRDNAQGEIYLTDVVGLARSEERGVATVLAEDALVAEGVNDRVQLAALAAELNRRTLEDWMRAGVTVVDPGSTWVDVTVRLEQDVRLLPGVQLHGATTVATGAVVGPDCTLTGVRVGSGAQVVRTHGADAVLGDGATVGPFAYLRPGTVLDAAGKIGTFVETKNSHIGPRAKVPHLSYIGDADVGAGANLGAGTITANYDGRAKHRTVIGARVRSAVHVSFVAPVRVGDDAWTAAGSVITHDVPPGALGVARERQRNVEGYAARKGGRPS